MTEEAPEFSLSGFDVLNRYYVIYILRYCNSTDPSSETERESPLAGYERVLLAGDFRRNRGKLVEERIDDGSVLGNYPSLPRPPPSSFHGCAAHCRHCLNSFKAFPARELRPSSPRIPRLYKAFSPRSSPFIRLRGFSKIERLLLREGKTARLRVNNIVVFFHVWIASLVEFFWSDWTVNESKERLRCGPSITWLSNHDVRGWSLGTYRLSRYRYVRVSIS